MQRENFGDWMRERKKSERELWSSRNAGEEV